MGYPEELFWVQMKQIHDPFPTSTVTVTVTPQESTPHGLAKAENKGVISSKAKGLCGRRGSCPPRHHTRAPPPLRRRRRHLMPRSVAAAAARIMLGGGGIEWCC